MKMTPDSGVEPLNLSEPVIGRLPRGMGLEFPAIAVPDVPFVTKFREYVVARYQGEVPNQAKLGNKSAKHLWRQGGDYLEYIWRESGGGSGSVFQRALTDGHRYSLRRYFTALRKEPCITMSKFLGARSAILGAMYPHLAKKLGFDFDEKDLRKKLPQWRRKVDTLPAGELLDAWGAHLDTREGDSLSGEVAASYKRGVRRFAQFLWDRHLEKSPESKELPLVDQRARLERLICEEPQRAVENYLQELRFEGKQIVSARSLLYGTFLPWAAMEHRLEFSIEDTRLEASRSLPKAPESELYTEWCHYLMARVRGEAPGRPKLGVGTAINNRRVVGRFLESAWTIMQAESSEVVGLSRRAQAKAFEEYLATNYNGLIQGYLSRLKAARGETSQTFRVSSSVLNEVTAWLKRDRKPPAASKPKIGSKPAAPEPKPRKSQRNSKRVKQRAPTQSKVEKFKEQVVAFGRSIMETLIEKYGLSRAELLGLDYQDLHGCDVRRREMESSTLVVRRLAEPHPDPEVRYNIVHLDRERVVPLEKCDAQAISDFMSAVRAVDLGQVWNPAYRLAPLFYFEWEGAEPF